MNAPSDMRAQLQSLRIDQAQRPVESPRAYRAGGPWTKRLFLLVVLAGVAGGAYAARGRITSAVDQINPPPEIRLLTVTARQEAGAPPMLTGTGKIVSDHRVQISTKVSGQIVKLFFEQGDRVTKGQVIAEIEDINYRALRDQAQARLEKARAQLAYQKINYERVHKLFESGNAPSIEHADATRWYHDAESEVAAAQAALDYARKAFNDCKVATPIAGVILERNVEVGDFVAAEGGRGAMANAQLASIADMASLRVEVDVSELDIARIHKAMPCRVAPDAYKDRVYRGRVMWLDPGANYSKATVQVKVRIEDPDDHLRIDGTAKVEFLGDGSSAPASQPVSRIWIPAAACRPAADGKSGRVFVCAGNRLKSVSISLGAISGGQIEVLDGLSPGQSIAADDLDKLTDGQRVQPKS